MSAEAARRAGPPYAHPGEDACDTGRGLALASRSRELDLLTALLSRLPAVALMEEAGMGKSRLVY